MPPQMRSRSVPPRPRALAPPAPKRSSAPATFGSCVYAGPPPIITATPAASSTSSLDAPAFIAFSTCASMHPSHRIATLIPTAISSFCLTVSAPSFISAWKNGANARPISGACVLADCAIALDLASAAGVV